MRHRSITASEVLDNLVHSTEDQLMTLAMENRLPAVRDREGLIIVDDDGAPLYHPVAEEIAREGFDRCGYAMHRPDWRGWQSVVEHLGYVARDILNRYESLAEEFLQREGAVPWLIEDNIKALKSLDFDDVANSPQTTTYENETSDLHASVREKSNTRVDPLAIPADEIAGIVALCNEEEVLELAAEKRLPVLSEPDGSIKFSDQGKALLHPVAVEIATEACDYLHDGVNTPAKKDWLVVGDAFACSIRDVAARYKMLANQFFELDGDVPELILERLEILESLDSEEPLRPEGREAAAG